MTEPTHQRGALPLPRVFRFTDPGAMAVVPQGRRVGIGALRMLDAELTVGRVLLHGEMLVIQFQDALTLVLADAPGYRVWHLPAGPGLAVDTVSDPGATSAIDHWPVAPV